jgi:inner membrane transporter RhtA
MKGVTAAERVVARRPPAAVLVATGAITVQLGAALATRLFSRVGPAGAVTLRVGFAALALVALNVAQGHHSNLARARWRDLGLALVFGIVLSGMNLAFYEALDRVPLGVAVTVEFVGPLAVTIGGSRRRTDFVWALLAGAGVFLLAGGGAIGAVHHLDLTGVGYALLAGIGWFGYILLNTQMGQRFGGTSGLAVAMVCGFAAVLPLGIVQAGARLVGPYVLAIGLAVALLSSVIPYSLELVALKRVTPRAFGILVSMDPAIAALAGLVVLGQRLSLIEVLALLLVVAANAGSSWFDARAPALPER